MKQDFSRSARRTIRIAILAAVFGVFLAGTGQASAATVVCGQVITQNTKVDNDLTNCPGDGLVIGASNIKLDLKGHTIDGDAVNAPTDDGIDNTGGFDNVRIEHGTIQQFQQGVHLVGATGNKLKKLRITETFRGIELETASDANKIEHNRVWANFDAIHLVTSDGNRIKHNDASMNTASGIVLIVGSDNNRVEHNKTNDNASWGITYDGTAGNVVSKNKVSGNDIAGIEPFNSTNTTIRGNKLKGNRIGIELFNTDTSLVEKNKIKESTLDGIHTFTGSTGNLLLKNHSDKNGDDGIDVADAGNTLTKNHADKNVDLGIFAAPGNVDGGGNKAHKNGNPAQCVGVSC
jgi:parallel beta-helix repeat protein